MATYEDSGSATIRLSASGVGAVLGASAAMSVAGQIMVPTPSPYDALHLMPDHYDLLGAGLMFGIGVAGIYAFARAMHWRDVL
jgi:hypothetical protein